MSKTLISGLGALFIGGIVKIALPALGIHVDTTVLQDGVITYADIGLVAGYVLLFFSEPLANQFRKTSIGYKVYGEPEIKKPGLN